MRKARGNQLNGDTASMLTHISAVPNHSDNISSVFHRDM